MAKAVKPKKKAKAKKNPEPKFTDKDQSERFIEAARALGIERTDDFGKVLAKVARCKQKQQP